MHQSDASPPPTDRPAESRIKTALEHPSDSELSEILDDQHKVDEPESRLSSLSPAPPDFHSSSAEGEQDLDEHDEHAGKDKSKKAQVPIKKSNPRKKPTAQRSGSSNRNSQVRASRDTGHRRRPPSVVEPATNKSNKDGDIKLAPVQDITLADGRRGIFTRKKSVYSLSF